MLPTCVFPPLSSCLSSFWRRGRKEKQKYFVSAPLASSLGYCVCVCFLWVYHHRQLEVCQFTGCPCLSVAFWCFLMLFVLPEILPPAVQMVFFWFSLTFMVNEKVTTSSPGHGSKLPFKTVCVRHPLLQTNLSHLGVQTMGERGLLPRQPCCPHRHMSAPPHPGSSHFCQVVPSFWPLGSWHHIPSKEQHCPNGLTQAHPSTKTKE